MDVFLGKTIKATAKIYIYIFEEKVVFSFNGNCMKSSEGHLSVTKKTSQLGTCQKLAGGRGGGNFNFGFGNEVTHPCNDSEIC